MGSYSYANFIRNLSKLRYTRNVPDTLAEMKNVDFDDMEISNALIMNPNTPNEILEKLNFFSVEGEGITRIITSNNFSYKVIDKIIHSESNIYVSVYLTSPRISLEERLSWFKKVEHDMDVEVSKIIIMLYQMDRQYLNAYMLDTYDIDTASMTCDMIQDILGHNISA
jgi:hypothetical protein